MNPTSPGNDAQWAETLTVWQALDLTLALRAAASAGEGLDVSDQPPVVVASVNCGDRRLNVGVGRSSDTGEVLVYIGHEQTEHRNDLLGC